MWFQKTWDKIKHYILLRALGQQYRMQKEIKNIIKSNNNDINYIIPEIQAYYNKSNYSLDELISRKFKLQNRNALEKNIIIPIFLGVFSSIIFYISSSDSLTKLLEKNLYAIKTIVEIVCAIIFAVCSIVVAAIFLVYLLYYIPSKNRCSESYIYEKELEIVEKQIGIKRNIIPEKCKLYIVKIVPRIEC